MRTLLRVDSSPRADSVSRQLTEAFATAWRDAYPGGLVRHHDLNRVTVPHLGPSELAAWFVPPDQHVDVHREVLGTSDRLIADVLAADDILIGSPMWNFSVTSSLKAWIDHVVRAGRTWRVAAGAPKVRAARAVVATAPGGDYRSGTPAAAMDFQEPYLRQVLGVIGVPEITFVHADHQGPTWTDRGDVLERALSEMRLLAGAPIEQAA